jgi:hypothetical protein
LLRLDGAVDGAESAEPMQIPILKHVVLSVELHLAVAVFLLGDEHLNGGIVLLLVPCQLY